MNISQMKNIVVLKDLPSNLIDEAIVILKNGNKIKIENEKKEENYETAIKEAEFIVQSYIKNLEKPKDNKSDMKKLKLQCKKNANI